MTLWISRPATWYSTFSAPVCQDSQSYQRRRRRHRSSQQVLVGRMGNASAMSGPTMAAVWLRKCPGFSVGTTNGQGARSDIARHLPIPLFLATYTVYTAACYRTEIGQRSTDRCHFKNRRCPLVFSALVSHSIYRRELSYKHAAQLYHQLSSQRRQGPHKLATHWQFLGTAHYSVGLI